MVQTENTAIVLRHVNYRDNDKMITLLSPTRGRVDALIRNCRKPKSHNLNSGELFALGDYMLTEANGRFIVTSVNLIETFYPLRSDYDKLAFGSYLLNLVEAVAEPDQEQKELFMLLLHTLSRLAFYDHDPKPLLAGFLLHFSVCQGFRPRLEHCVLCGKRLPEEGELYFDIEEGGLCCAECRTPGVQEVITRAQADWMRMALGSGSASWVNTERMYAPTSVLKKYVENKLGRRFRSGGCLPEM